jgi:hypothetical protein
VLEILDTGVKGRLHDVGAVYAEGVSRADVGAMANAAGLAPDTAFVAVGPKPAGRGLMGLQLALTTVLAGTSELALALFAPTGEADVTTWVGATFASGDYFRFSTASPTWRLDGTLVAGYEAGQLDQDIRGAIERCLIRAEVRLDDVGSLLVAASQPVREAACAAFGTAATDGHASARDVLAAIAGDAGANAGPHLILVDDDEDRVVCATVARPA